MREPSYKQIRTGIGATPLGRSKKGLRIGDYTIHNAVARLREQGDIFSGVLNEGIILETVLKKIDAVFSASFTEPNRPVKP